MSRNRFMNQFLLSLLFGGGPGTPITKLPPFVTDTLFRLLGAFPVRQESASAAPITPRGTRYAALTVPPDTVKLYGNQPDRVITHEAGHVLDLRNLAPSVTMHVARRSAEYKHPDDYFGSEPSEYVAEAFARAVESGRRRGFSDSTKVDKDFPGSIDFIRWLLTRPPFAKNGN